MDDFAPAEILVFVFAPKFPFQTVDNAFDASLKNIRSDPHGAPSVGAI